MYVYSKDIYLYVILQKWSRIGNHSPCYNEITGTPNHQMMEGFRAYWRGSATEFYQRKPYTLICIGQISFAYVLSREYNEGKPVFEAAEHSRTQILITNILKAWFFFPLPLYYTTSDYKCKSNLSQYSLHMTQERLNLGLILPQVLCPVRVTWH